MHWFADLLASIVYHCSFDFRFSYECQDASLRAQSLTFTFAEFRIRVPRRNGAVDHL